MELGVSKQTFDNSSSTLSTISYDRNNLSKQDPALRIYFLYFLLFVLFFYLFIYLFFPDIYYHFLCHINNFLYLRDWKDFFSSSCFCKTYIEVDMHSQSSASSLVT